MSVHCFRLHRGGSHDGGSDGGYTSQDSNASSYAAAARSAHREQSSVAFKHCIRQGVVLALLGDVVPGAEENAIVLLS